MRSILFIFLLLFFIISSCNNNQREIYLGADLSYVNEMEDHGGIYRSKGEQADPFELFAQKGANIVRVRLWHSPLEWTSYSNYLDVKKTIKRSKENGMAILLDFHYSDKWADPQKQIIPKAWEKIEDLEVLGDSVYNYTYNILMNLAKENLVPEMVQVGNETNIEILQQKDSMIVDTISWERNIFLLNKGIDAVNRVSQKLDVEIQTMIHIAQPENSFWWFKEAFKNGIHEFDWIGLSYYPKWSEYPLNDIPIAIDSLKKLYDIPIIIVETAYPHTLENVDSAGNILGKDALIMGYPATHKGQKEFMVELTKLALKGGADGVIYWEPAWISSKAVTPWGSGSHWDNATFFDAFNNNEALPVFDFFNQSIYQ
jgi:arabinogalactan endo-1,4-beta-galactosidase